MIWNKIDFAVLIDFFMALNFNGYGIVKGRGIEPLRVPDDFPS
jgi:hypothetical protein